MLILEKVEITNFTLKECAYTLYSFYYNFLKVGASLPNANKNQLANTKTNIKIWNIQIYNLQI